MRYGGFHLREAIQNIKFIFSSPKLLINRWIFSNPHQLFWSTSVEVNKAGFPALKEDFVPSAKLPCCYIQVLNSKYCQKTGSNSKDCQKRRFNHVELPADKIESLESTSAQQRAESQISNEVKEEIAVSSRNHLNWLVSDGVYLVLQNVKRKILHFFIF